MPKICIIAAGKFGKGPLSELFKEYERRLDWPLAVREVDIRHGDGQRRKIEEIREISALINTKAFRIVLDEKGKSLSSTDFSKTLDRAAQESNSEIQFIIGGADGLDDVIRSQAHLLLSFGKQTWPHLLARVMLLEQIYRARQISKGHPYHGE